MGERQKAGEMTEVLPNQRYNAHLVPEDGTLTCSTPGICKCPCPGLKLLPLTPAWEAPLSPDTEALGLLELQAELPSARPSPAQVGRRRTCSIAGLVAG